MQGRHQIKDTDKLFEQERKETISDLFGLEAPLCQAKIVSCLERLLQLAVRLIKAFEIRAEVTKLYAMFDLGMTLPIM